MSKKRITKIIITGGGGIRHTYEMDDQAKKPRVKRIGNRRSPLEYQVSQPADQESKCGSSCSFEDPDPFEDGGIDFQTWESESLEI
jgi:hypothetical protein